MRLIDALVSARNHVFRISYSAPRIRGGACPHRIRGGACPHRAQGFGSTPDATRREDTVGGNVGCQIRSRRANHDPNSRHAFNLAYSNGPYRSFARQCAEGIECTSRLEVARAHWLHMGWGFEFLMDQGSIVRVDWGVAALLNPWDARRVDETYGTPRQNCRQPSQNLALMPLLLVAPLLRLSPCAEDTCSDPPVFVAMSAGHSLL
jgi:hypothetical protein